MADVMKFSTPKRRLVFERHSLDENKERHKRCIRDHYFNHSASLVIPNYSSKKLAKQLQYNTPVNDVFCSAVLPVHVFVDRDFIDRFINQGEFYAVSSATHIDRDNCVAVLPTGILVLSLNKDTYEELGLTGKHSIFQKNMRFIVEIDLKAPSFYPGKKNYDRVSWCLKKEPELQFDFMFSWTDKDKKANVEALQNYFSSYKCQCIHNTENIKTLTNLEIPVITPDIIKTAGDGISDATSFYEWLGCVHCDVDCGSGSPDSYISTLTCPQPSVNIERVTRCQWRGFITPQRIINILETARSILQSSSSHPPPWVALSVWGFADSPVTWLTNEHGYQYGGENMYTIVVFPDNQYWFYGALGSHDICS